MQLFDKRSNRPLRYGKFVAKNTDTGKTMEFSLDKNGYCPDIKLENGTYIAATYRKDGKLSVRFPGFEIKHTTTSNHTEDKPGEMCS